jgi:predicted nucleotidyltransferase component of viral defense system
VTAIYLHDHKDFPDLLQIIEEETGILAGLVEKDYWIMHALYGLKKQGYNFQLKGGTSLSKGFGIIERFSEDIDLHITPPQELGINENPNNSNAKNIERKKQYYDVYSLLSRQEILDFIGTEEYLQHKERRFPATDFAIPVRENEAFLLNDAEVRNRLQKRYEQSKTLYYKGQPPLEDILSRIKLHIGKL